MLMCCYRVSLRELKHISKCFVGRLNDHSLCMKKHNNVTTKFFVMTDKELRSESNELEDKD